jgi:hypothetical protein
MPLLTQLTGSRTRNQPGKGALAMPSKKQPLDLRSHRNLGRLLKGHRNQLMNTKLPYPKNSAQQRYLTGAIKSIDKLRCSLDGQAARDLGDDFDTRLYYGDDVPW